MKSSEIKLSSEYKFGLFFSLVFYVLGWYFFSDQTTILSYVLYVVATTLLLVTILNAKLLTTLNKLWMRFGILLGMIVGPIVFGFIFFGLFTPIALLMKLFRRDELRLKLKTRNSYWKSKHIINSHPNSFEHQF